MTRNSLGSLRKGDFLYHTKGSTLIKMEVVEVTYRGIEKPNISKEPLSIISIKTTNLHTIKAVNRETGETRIFHLSRFEEDEQSLLFHGQGLFLNKKDAYIQVYRESLKELRYCDNEIERCLKKVAELKKLRNQARSRVSKYIKQKQRTL